MEARKSIENQEAALITLHIPVYVVRPGYACELQYGDNCFIRITDEALFDARNFLTAIHEAGKAKILAKKAPLTSVEHVGSYFGGVPEHHKSWYWFTSLVGCYDLAMNMDRSRVYSDKDRGGRGGLAFHLQDQEQLSRKQLVSINRMVILPVYQYRCHHFVPHLIEDSEIAIIRLSPNPTELHFKMSCMDSPSPLPDCSQSLLGEFDHGITFNSCKQINLAKKGHLLLEFAELERKIVDLVSQDYPTFVVHPAYRVYPLEIDVRHKFTFEEIAIYILLFDKLNESGLVKDITFSIFNFVLQLFDRENMELEDYKTKFFELPRIEQNNSECSKFASVLKSQQALFQLRCEKEGRSSTTISTSSVSLWKDVERKCGDFTFQDKEKTLAKFINLANALQNGKATQAALMEAMISPRDFEVLRDKKLGNAVREFTSFIGGLEEQMRESLRRTM